MKKLLLVAAVVLVFCALAPARVEACQWCTSACGTSYASGYATRSDCPSAEAAALSAAEASTGGGVCWNDGPYFTCTGSGSTRTAHAWFDYIVYTPCHIC